MRLNRCIFAFQLWEGFYDALKSAASEEIHLTYQQVTGNVLCLAMSILGFSEIHSSVDGLTINAESYPNTEVRVDEHKHIHQPMQAPM